MKPDKLHLIHDLLDGQCDAHREATLLAGARILRRRRIWRRTRHGAALLAVLAATALWIELKQAPQPPLQASAPPPIESSAPAGAQSLTDDELLALFPNTPVGLATLADGRKRLIFPHPGDERKFVTPL